MIKIVHHAIYNKIMDKKKKTNNNKKSIKMYYYLIINFKGRIPKEQLKKKRSIHGIKKFQWPARF